MSVDSEDLVGRVLLVLLVRTGADYREEFASVVGRVFREGDCVMVDRGEDGPPLEIPPFVWSDIHPSDENMRRGFGECDYLVSIRIDTQDDPDQAALFESVGLHWEG